MNNAARLLAVACICFAATGAYGQVTVDVSKISCEQYLGFRVADPRDIAIWLSGFYHGKNGNTLFYPQQLRENVEKLKSACFQSGNAKRMVVEVANELLAKEK